MFSYEAAFVFHHGNNATQRPLLDSVAAEPIHITLAEQVQPVLQPLYSAQSSMSLLAFVKLNHTETQ